ncbi:hypothetical protein GALMADRAFT_280457 [Galerina marginata CBS 339.88]|uniref:Uncharacterized protein n=1 Tax=Galerina marginata (strain CBS 339.88) TaxID=685588 RepID=A0A067SUT9_GALM3|nr:hypothetical protein GALMADRAFT_280457 [Galerina marginata CBS 339.88]
MTLELQHMKLETKYLDGYLSSDGNGRGSVTGEIFCEFIGIEVLKVVRGEDETESDVAGGEPESNEAVNEFDGVEADDGLKGNKADDGLEGDGADSGDEADDESKEKLALLASLFRGVKYRCRSAIDAVRRQYEGRHSGNKRLNSSPYANANAYNTLVAIVNRVIRHHGSGSSAWTAIEFVSLKWTQYGNEYGRICAETKGEIYL